MRLLLLLSLLAAFAMAGCGDDDETTTTPSANPPEESTPAGGAAGEDTGGSAAGGEEVTISMKNIQFDPQSVTVSAGQTVTWVNEDDVQHDVDFTSGGDFESDLIGKGGEIEWKAEGSGEIEYVCSVHPNMTGTITVE